MPTQPVRVTSVSVEGVTAYPLPDITALAAGLVGPAIPLPQIDAARLAILQRYRADGYVLSAVSVNFDVASGRLRFIVTEGHIASVKLDGDIGPAGTQVLRFLNHLTEVQPINSATLERCLLLAQDVPGVTMHAVLQPSADDPGALNLIAQVSRQAISGLATVDNRAFVHTGPIEALGVVDFNSFSEFGEKSRGRALSHLPQQRDLRPGRHRDVPRRIGPQAAASMAVPGQPTRPARSPRRTTSARQRCSAPVELPGDPLTASRRSNVHLNFDGIQSIVDLGTPSVLSSYDSLRVLRLSADYALSDLLLGADRSALNSVIGPRLPGPANPRRHAQQRAERSAAGRADQFHQVRLPAQP